MTPGHILTGLTTACIGLGLGLALAARRAPSNARAVAAPATSPAVAAPAPAEPAPAPSVTLPPPAPAQPNARAAAAPAEAPGLWAGIPPPALEERPRVDIWGGAPGAEGTPHDSKGPAGDSPPIMAPRYPQQELDR